MQESIFLKHSELKELLHVIRHEIQQAQRPASEIVLGDADIMKMLNISRRKLQYLISNRVIPYYHLPGCPRRYYYLQDILDVLEKNKVKSISPKL